MSNVLKNKIDFAIIIKVKNANPNGDPINGNRPRINIDGLGEISDVAIKRKLRNRLMDLGENILMQSHDYKNDNHQSVQERYQSEESIKKLKDDNITGSGSKKKVAPTLYDELIKHISGKWIDIRTFGQVLAGIDDDMKSIAIRGPLSIQSAFSVEPVEFSSMQITKSMNSKNSDKELEEGFYKKGSDTMGMKHRVDYGVYVTYGSINPQLAEKTGFTHSDADLIKKAMQTLFENDATSARPSGSMEVIRVIWWEQAKDDNKEILSSAKIHKSLTVDNSGEYTLDSNLGIIPEELEGM